MVNTDYNNIINLPLEVNVSIISKLDLKSLLSISSVCKGMHLIGNIIATNILKDKRITIIDNVLPIFQLSKNLSIRFSCLNKIIGIAPGKNLFNNLDKLDEILARNENKLTIAANNLIKSCAKVMPCKAGVEKDEELKILIESGAKISNLLCCLQAGFSPEIIELLLCHKNYLDTINADHVKAVELNNYPDSIKLAINKLILTQQATQILRSCNHTLSEKEIIEKEKQLQELVDKGAEITELETCLRANFSHILIEKILNNDCYTGSISLHEIEAAISNRYPNYIIIALTQRLKVDIDFYSTNLLKIILKSNLPTETLKGIISKINSISYDCVADLINHKLPEDIVLALLDRLTQANGFLALVMWGLVFENDIYSTELMKKMLDINTKAGISFPLHKYNVEYCTKLYNDSFVISLVNNQTEMSLKFLERGIETKLSPLTILNIYKKAPRKERGVREDSWQFHIRYDAIRFLFRSGINEIIHELSLMNEYPCWGDVTHAIETKQDEKTLHLLLDAYEKEESSEHGSCGFHYTSYANFLYSALVVELSDSIIERILNKVRQIDPSTIELARKKGRSSELIERLEKKL